MILEPTKINSAARATSGSDEQRQVGRITVEAPPPTDFRRDRQQTNLSFAAQRAGLHDSVGALWKAKSGFIREGERAAAREAYDAAQAAYLSKRNECEVD